MEKIILGGKKTPKLDPTALHGLAGDVCNYLSDKSEATSVAILAQFLTLFGNCIGRSAHFQIEADLHYAKLFTIIVGKSAKARKGVSLGQAKRLFSLAQPDWIKTCVVSGLSSGEGLIHRLSDNSSIEDPFVTINPKDKRLLVEESEFASVLRQTQRQGNTLSVFIRKAWDSDTLQVLTRDPVVASDSHVSIIGHITGDELVNLMNATEMANGFANRMMWIYSERQKLLPLGVELDQEFLNFHADLLSKSISFAQKVGRVSRDDDANKLWVQIYEELAVEKYGLLGSLLSRGEPYIMRLAMIYALLDQSAYIRRAHLAAAYSLWKYAEETCEYIFSNKMGFPDADTIYTGLLNAPEGLSRTQIAHNLFQKNRNKEELDRALNFLRDRKLIEESHVKTDGRNKEVWRCTKILITT